MVTLPPAPDPAVLDDGRQVGQLLAVDGVLAVGLIGFLGVVLGGATGSTASFALAVALCGPLALRRVAPRVCTALVAAVALGQLVLTDVGLAAPDFAVVVALYSATAYASWAFSVGALALASAGGLALALRDAGGSLGFIVPGALYVLSAVVAWTLGALRRNQFDRARTRLERLRLIESDRAQQVRLAVGAERARIAREMHDVVAHSLAVVIAQADGGRYAARTDPEAATVALETIAQTGRTALAEMRRLLGVLRDDGPSGAAASSSSTAPTSAPPTPERGTPPTQPLAPQPGLDDVVALVERVASGGLPVTLDVEGTPRQAPSGVQLTAYRIVQEGLTNVLKHAGPTASAAVRLRWATDRLVVEVSDDGRGAGAPVSPGGGHGIIGMRERVGLDGGTISVGPRPGGGFAVRAELPVGPG